MYLCTFITPFFYGEVLILFFKWEAYISKIIFLTENVEHFPGIYYGRYTLTLINIHQPKMFAVYGPILSFFYFYVLLNTSTWWPTSSQEWSNEWLIITPFHSGLLRPTSTWFHSHFQLLSSHLASLASHFIPY